MKAHDYLTDDGQVMLALCSAFGLKDSKGATELQPLKLSEWNELARQIERSAFKVPAALHGQPVEILQKELAIPQTEAERLSTLLERSGRMALDLENLFSRGMWAVTRADELYPTKLRDSLKHQAPTVLFGAGDIGLLNRSGVAVVGSRNIDQAGIEFAKALGRKAANARVSIVSGGARGTDRIAMDGALQSDGVSAGVLADSLESTVRKPDVRELLLDDRLVLLTPYSPTAGFSVGGAMGRNKVIYGLADFAIIVSSDFQTGGTWAGALEALKAEWCPIFVRESEDAPKGNRELLKLGAKALPTESLSEMDDLPAWLRKNANSKLREQDLFGG